MKQLMIQEMKRAIELVESIETKEAETKAEYVKNKKLEEETGRYHWTIDKAFKERAELKKLLKMVRLHSVVYEKGIR
jgi:hypothetical protein